MRISDHPGFIEAVSSARLLPRHVEQIIMYIETIEAGAAALLDEAEVFFQAQNTSAPELSKDGSEPDRSAMQSEALSLRQAVSSQVQTTYSPPQGSNDLPRILNAKPAGVEV